jgi:tetratricopeptide (TPR) repeat protein
LAYVLSGRVDEAVRLLERATRSGPPSAARRPSLRLTLSERYLLAGRFEEASTLANSVLERARIRKQRGSEAEALRLRGNIAARRQPPESESAEVHYRQTLPLAEELRMRPLQAHCHLGLGTLYVQTGRPELARAALTAAVALYRDMEMTFWLPQAEAALVQVS